MDNSLNNSISSKTITLANLGTTKCGKTTSIAVLTNVAETIINLASGDDGRTKTTVEYHIVPETQNNSIFIEEIDLFEQNIMGSADGNIEKYNAQIAKFKVLKAVLNLDKLDEGQNVRDYIKQQKCKLINKAANENQLKKLMCSETIDRFVRKLVLRVPAQVVLGSILENREIDLRIRDTRGLLDVMLGSDLKSQTSKSLSELGLDNLDGIVFFCSTEYPNIIGELYKDLLKSVFESVPVFLIHNRTDVMFEMFSINGQQYTHSNLDIMIDSIQQKKHPIFKPEVVMAKSNSTFKLLKQLNIGRFHGSEFVFNDSYFVNEKIQFLLPACNSLATETSVDILSNDFKFYQMATIVSYEKIIDMISNLQEGMSKIFSANIARNIIWNLNNNLSSILQQDFLKYDNPYNSNNATYFVKPQLQYLKRTDISNNISDTSLNNSRLGTRGGITTMNNGKLRYATTAVVAIAARRWITHLISKIEISSPLVDSNGVQVFDDTKITVDIQQNLLRKALFNRLYKHYTDTEATIQYYLLVKRSDAVNGINNTCKQNNSFNDVITDIVHNFI